MGLVSSRNRLGLSCAWQIIDKKLLFCTPACAQRCAGEYTSPVVLNQSSIRLDILIPSAFFFRVVDFKNQLRRQILFIQNSCRLYDEAHVEEAIRIAVALRVVFYDSKHSVSLLQHLRAKSIFILSTADIPQKHQNHNLALVSGFANVPDARLPIFSCEMRPVLDDPKRRDFVHFQTWWRKEIIIELGADGSLNRRDLALTAANKDGGAHVDIALPLTYDKTRLGAGMELEITFKTGPKTVKMPFENVHYASLRQIAYEVLNSPAISELSATHK